MTYHGDDKGARLGFGDCSNLLGFFAGIKPAEPMSWLLEIAKSSSGEKEQMSRQFA
jgi:hypothetical protein